MTTIIINTHHTIQRVNVQRLDESLDELLSPTIKEMYKKKGLTVVSTMHIPTNRSQIVKQWVGDNQRIEIKWTIILSRFLIKKNSSSLLIALYIVYSPIVC